MIIYIFSLDVITIGLPAADPRYRGRIANLIPIWLKVQDYDMIVVSRFARLFAATYPHSSLLKHVNHLLPSDESAGEAPTHQ